MPPHCPTEIAQRLANCEIKTKLDLASEMMMGAGGTDVPGQIALIETCVDADLGTVFRKKKLIDGSSARRCVFVAGNN